MKKLVLGIVVAMLAALGTVVGTATSASAHTSTFSADCNGVVLHAQSYDGSKANKWSVTIGGSTQSGTFGATYDNTFPVPQAGATTSWSAVIEAYDGNYKFTDSGSVGPCGTPPPTDACPNVPGTQPPGTNCNPPQPEPVKHKVRGAVQKIDKCGTKSDLFKLKTVRGGEYLVKGKVRVEGKWLRANASRVNVYFKASNKHYKVVGQTHWHLKFSQKGCATPPTNPPHTGARTVA